MKININQKLLGVDGVEVLKGEKGMPLILKDICITSLLSPNQQDIEKVKWDKYEIFKRLRDALLQNGEIWVDLKLEELTMIKNVVGKTQTPLIMGQCWEMLEGAKSESLKNVK